MRRVEKSIIVNVSPEQVYNTWRDFERFPRFMSNIREVRRTGDRSFHWIAEGPMGKTFEWDAEMTEDQPNQSIGWNSTGGDIQTSGQVTFQSLDQGTEVHVTMNYYDVPGGGVGEAISGFLHDPDKRLEEDLRNFKQVVEAGVTR